MFSPYWSWSMADAVMNEFELGFDGADDDSSAIMHRFSKATGVPYNISHNYWRLDSTGR